MIRNKYMNQSKDNIKMQLIDIIEHKYAKKTNRGRPNILSISECLDAIFLCSF